LYTGKVVVKAASKAMRQKVKEVYLIPGQQLEFGTEYPEGRVSTIVEAVQNPKRLTPRPEMEEGTMTINGDIIEFSKRPLPAVLDELSRLYARDIRYRRADISRISFTGRVSMTDSLERVLQTIAVLNELK